MGAVSYTHLVLIMIVAGGLSSCSALFQGGGGAVIGSSFTAEDEDIIGANDDYKALETALRNRLNGIEEEYPGYDEYRYHVDEINHNPYELTAYLTVLFEDYTLSLIHISFIRACFQARQTKGGISLWHFSTVQSVFFRLL